MFVFDSLRESSQVYTSIWLTSQTNSSVILFLHCPYSAWDPQILVRSSFRHRLFKSLQMSWILSESGSSLGRDAREKSRHVHEFCKQSSYVAQKTGCFSEYAYKHPWEKCEYTKSFKLYWTSLSSGPSVWQELLLLYSFWFSSFQMKHWIE